MHTCAIRCTRACARLARNRLKWPVHAPPNTLRAYTQHIAQRQHALHRKMLSSRQSSASPAATAPSPAASGHAKVRAKPNDPGRQALTLSRIAHYSLEVQRHLGQVALLRFSMHSTLALTLRTVARMEALARHGLLHPSCRRRDALRVLRRRVRGCSTRWPRSMLMVCIRAHARVPPPPAQILTRTCMCACLHLQMRACIRACMRAHMPYKLRVATPAHTCARAHAYCWVT